MGSEQIIEMYDAAADDYTEAFFNRETLQAELHYVESFLSHISGGGRILDVGCGPGIEAELIRRKRFHYEGIDASEKMIAIARMRNPMLSFHVMDMRTLLFPNDHFDGVMALESMIHFQKSEVAGVLRELYRVLKKNGALLLALQKGAGQKLYRFPFDQSKRVLVNLYQPGEMQHLLEHIGFQVLKTMCRKPLVMEFKNDKLIVIARRLSWEHRPGARIGKNLSDCDGG